MHKLLEGKTLVLTGSQKSSKIIEQIEELGGEVVVCPLIQTVELIDEDDELNLQKYVSFDWIIFTSQNGVESFCKKLERYHFNACHFSGKIAAVGEKTAQLLEKNGFTVSFMPSIYSADVFVQEFPQVSGVNPKCLFVRGERAKDTLKKYLPFPIHEWNVYTTDENTEYIDQLIETIQTRNSPIVIFASPSAVDCYHKYVAHHLGWNHISIASIGHVTSEALKRYGATVTYQPKKYTMQSVIEEIVKGEVYN